MSNSIDWPQLPAAQQPEWSDPAALAEVRSRLSKLPPLVFAGECDQLTERLAEVAVGNAFVLMGGDCAETYAANTADSIRARLKTVLQMAVVLTYGAQVPVVKIGRLAGQYFKPRSSALETRSGVTLPSYFGDGVNGMDFDAESRRLDPERLVAAYHASSATLNLVRAFTQGGYADLRQVHAWNQDFVRDSTAGERYEQVAGEIDRALAFMHACGVDPEEFRRVDLYAAHEALVLDYEQPLVRIDSRTGRPYSVSGHFLWIGERTRDPGGAHVQFAGRISNPIGIKLGPDARPEDAAALVELLDPDRKPGRLTLITRMGVDRIEDRLPPLVEKVRAGGHQVVWVCDPMHGNTRTVAAGHKTRLFDDIVGEVRKFFQLHRDIGSNPGGIHIELTGDDVTECLGGAVGIEEVHLPERYETACDPRLNREQSLELAFLVSQMLS
ncbi:MAG: 3-deoxy-7-phosphoheptulonate synthase class II [Candidatus Nanopelagicales bacterium]|nr:3-deoxy-7-phosphoheptulonate synthase class II [Candidatus Nanopelagicales bacterium]